jgi:hypothetical protein
MKCQPLILTQGRAYVEVQFSTPLELLYLALGIALIGAAIYLSHPREGRHG